MWLTLSSSLVSYHWPVFCDMQRGKCNLYLIATKCVLVLLWGRSKSQQQTKLREKCGNIQMFKWCVIFLQIYSHSYLDLLNHFKRKKKHVQTDKMWNIGRRKCKYFGAASFSFFIFLFVFFLLKLRNFFILLLHLSFLSVSVQMPFLCALCSHLSSWILLFSHQTTYWERKERQTRGREQGEKRKCIHSCFSIQHGDALTHSGCATRQ